MAGPEPSGTGLGAQRAPAAAGDLGRAPHPLLAGLALEPWQPLAFWRDRWHWPWWDVARFRATVSAIGLCLDAERRDLGAERAEAQPSLVFVPRRHPLTRAVEAAAQRCGWPLLLASEGSSPPHGGDPATPSTRLCQLECDEQQGRFELRRPPHGASVVAGAQPVDLEAVAVALGEDAARLPRPGGSDRRPAVLLAGSGISEVARLGMVWGAGHRACWLFADPGRDFVEDLLWSRAHAAFVGIEECAALAARLETGRRPQRRALERLELLVVDVAAGRAAARRGENDVRRLAVLLAERARAPTRIWVRGDGPARPVD